MRRRRPKPGPVLTLFAVLLCAAPGGARADDEMLRFAVVGDTPYTANDHKFLTKKLMPALRAAPYPFVIHVGDIIAGDEACDPVKLEARREQILEMHPDKVFYTPGDNEWTDCDREKEKRDDDDGTSRPELEALDFLRRLFFPAPLELPEGWDFASQPNFPENARWVVDGVAFATVHLVSTNNGRVEIRMDDVELALSLVEARDQANRVWLDALFSEVKLTARAIVIATQADVTSPDGDGPCDAVNRMACDAFAGFRTQLIRLASKYGKPVLLVHGDTNPYCMDKTFGVPTAPNLWRLNASGDYYRPAPDEEQASDATEIIVRPGSSSRPFEARTVVGGRPPSDGCR